MVPYLSGSMWMILKVAPLAAAVDYDTNIDLFVGDAVEIDATAVIGDVSGSYEPLSEGSSSRYYGNALEFS